MGLKKPLLFVSKTIVFIYNCGKSLETFSSKNCQRSQKNLRKSSYTTVI